MTQFDRRKMLALAAGAVIATPALAQPPAAPGG
ncbi:MAG: hypothetical protein JWM33_2238, partial [Caulobacteraceae bacterium]|nr:hypothetical protein [Caulobacteraceae bacterium]